MITISHPDLDRFALEHFVAVREQLRLDRKYTVLNRWFRQHGLKISLEEAIIAPFPRLKQICHSYSKVPVGVSQLLKTMYDKKFAKSNSGIGQSMYNAVQLVQKLGIRVCPYCNRNYVNNVKTSRSVKRTSQLDHFFNKEKYPFLAMSFYNLVPVCPACNLLKHRYDISASPYDPSVNWDEEVRFQFQIKSPHFLKNEKDIEVKLKYSQRVKDNIQVLGLEDQYKTHNDLVHELLKKGFIYSHKRLDEIMREFPGLFRNREEMMRVIFGNYLEESALQKRTLSKLTRDIVQKIYFYRL
jgi:hypothetical protein